MNQVNSAAAMWAVFLLALVQPDCQAKDTVAALQNYPNPFNPSTTIKFSIPNSQFVTLKVYDMLGREVTTLVNEGKPAGNYEVKFNGNGLASGTYFYQIRAGNFVETTSYLLTSFQL